MTSLPASLPPPDLPQLDPAWSRLVQVPTPGGRTHTWHVLEHSPAEPVGTLLCVHGNPTWSYLWRALLADPPPRWRVIAPDQLGMGYSERPAGMRRVAERVADLGCLTDALDVTGPVVTLGHDWGGAISLGWAQQHRDLLTGVILTNTAVALASTEDRGPGLIRLAHLRAVRDVACRRTPFFVRAASAVSRPPLDREVRDALAAPYGSSRRRTAVADFVEDIPFETADPSAPTVEAIAEGVRELDVPALLLWGPRDPVFSERYLRDLRDRLPHADLHRYPLAGHLLTEDAPEYADAVRTWLADLGTTPPERPASSAANVLRHLERRRPDPTPAVVEVGGRTVSWVELADEVDVVATGLAAAGVEPGDRVALLVPPSVDLTVAAYAVWRARGVVVAADQGLGLIGMRRALRSAGVQHTVAAGRGLVAARAMRLPGQVIPVEGLRRDLPSRTWAEPDPRTDGAVLFTSGATGPAKGVVYRRDQLAAQVTLLRDAYGLTDDDRLVAGFAPFALLGPLLGLPTCVPAVPVTHPQRLTAPLLADAVAALDGTVVFAAPAALRTVAATAGDLDPAGRAALTGVRLLLSAGAPVPASLLRQVCSVLPNAEAHTPYGMTEALPVTDVSLAEIEAAGDGNGVCVGSPLAGVRVAVSALDASGRATGTPVAEPGVTGEILVSAAHVKERYDALWLTDRQSRRDAGWHRTGDVGHLDAEGRLWVEGRLVHVVTAAQGPVTPVGVEQRVEGVPGVRQAAAVGVGPPGAQVVIVVVSPASSAGRRSVLAPEPLADAVRAAAGIPVAAVLQRSRLPVDIRHASKVDRQWLARWATGVLAGRR